MTREEKETIFNQLSELEEQHPAFSESVRDNAYCEAIADVKRIIERINEPSLPSNLDEAAEEIAWDIAPMYPDISWDTCFEKIKDGIKAGAEWMAGQGQTFEAHVDNGCAIASGVKLPFVLWDTYEDGDVLKVQIRKKQ